MSGPYGNVLDGSDVEQAMIAHLEFWLPSMIEYVRNEKDPEGKQWPERESGPPVAMIRSFTVSHADAAAQHWAEDQLPMIVAQSPGQEGDPIVEGDGNVEANYGIILSAIASSVTDTDAKELARLYASAARLAVVFNPQLDAGTGEPFACSLKMGPERNGQVRRGVEGERNLAVCSIPFVVGVPSILNVAEGPLEAPEDPAEEPEPRPKVKEGGGSATVESLTEAGFFDAKP